MKILKKSLIFTVLAASLLGAFCFFWVSPHYTVPILTYHRFGYDKSTLFVTPENFERQMHYLKKNNYRVISLDELIRKIKSGAAPKGRVAVITVDDGYKDVYAYFYPILKKYGFPATIFTIAGLIGNREDFMDWKQIKIMAQNDTISFGGHSDLYLPSLQAKDTLWQEIAGCKKLLEEKTGRPVDYYAYPTGGFTEEIKTLVREAGYKGACTTNRGFDKRNRDIYELKRVKVTNSDPSRPFSFWAKLSGYYNIFRTLKEGG